jgi:hypothetical protein
MDDSESDTPDPESADYKAAYWADLTGFPIGEKLAITGQLLFTRDYTKRQIIAMGVRDITGTVKAILALDKKDLIVNVKTHSRVRIVGMLARNSRDELIIDQVEDVKNLGSLNAPYSQLDVELREHASRMFLSRIVNDCASTLRANGFEEFDSKVISTEWIDGGLEPLQVLYPGFGNPATLATSPSAQVMDFLNATGVAKAFTSSISFTTTFRHPNNAAETRIIVAKAVDLTLENLQSLIWLIANRVLEKLRVQKQSSEAQKILEKPWPDKSFDPEDNSLIYLFRYSGDVPTGGIGWRSTFLEHVIHVTNSKGSILIEGSFEKIGQRVVSGLTIFPSQFLSFIDATQPKRQLSDLKEYITWIQ